MPGTDDEAPTNGLHPQRIVYDTEINAARNILARATDPQINRYTATHEVKRILIDRAGTVENCPTTTQATTTQTRLPQFVGTFRGSAERLCW